MHESIADRKRCGNEERLYGLTPVFIVALSPQNWGDREGRLMLILRIIAKKGGVPLRVVF